MNKLSPVNSDTRKKKLDDPAKTWPLLKRMIGEMVRPYIPQLIFASIAMILVAGATAATAWLMDPVVNKVFVEKDEAMLWLVGGGVLGAFAVKSLAAYIQEVLMNFVGQRIVANTQNRLFGHLVGHDLALFQSRHTGILISHFTFDINAMRVATSNILVGLGRDSLTVVFLVAVMVYQEWSLAVITLVVGPLAVYPIQRIGKRMRRFSTQTQEEMGALTTHLSQCFQGIRVIKAYGMEAYEKDRVAGLVETIFQLTFRASRVRAAAQPIIDTMGGAAVAAVIIYGGYRVIEGVTTPGAFFSFIAAALMAYQPLRALGKLNANLQEGLAAAERVFDLLDTKSALPDPENPVAVERISGGVRFDNVQFSYGENLPALDGVSFEAPSGKIAALVGPSGAGKSTVLSLIPRMFDANEGTISVNTVDVSAASTKDLRDAMALVSQEINLFDDTVFNNIRYGRPEASEAEVHEAAKAAAAHDFIGELENGYETVVGEQGVKLSGGQRQRIAIARAILKDAPILLLDEATSALDTESERHIQSALEHLMKGRTTIVIAHRLSTIAHADVIHVFDHGKVVESGTHDELLEQSGLYAKLHGMQFRDPDTLAEG